MRCIDHAGTLVRYRDVSDMGLFNRRRADTAELAQLRAELAELRARLDATAAQESPPPSTPTSTPPPPPVPVVPVVAPPVSAVVDAAINDLRTQVARIDEQLATIDQRVNSVSKELTNQLDELSGDIESLGEQLRDAAESDTGATDSIVDASVLDELRAAQIRLANEQARYQIAFREDLADAMRELRRPGHS